MPFVLLSYGAAEKLADSRDSLVLSCCKDLCHRIVSYRFAFIDNKPQLSQEKSQPPTLVDRFIDLL